MDIDLEKEKIRNMMRHRLQAQVEKERLSKSHAVMAKVRSLAVFHQAKTIMFYCATDQELSTQDLIEEAHQKGKRILLPYVDPVTHEIKPSRIENLKEDLVLGSYD